jgi:hypothetical protein
MLLFHVLWKFTKFFRDRQSSYAVLQTHIQAHTLVCVLKESTINVLGTNSNERR